MKRKMPIEKLVRWRFQLAKSEAPSRPSAAQLLASAMAWWERYPDDFQSLVERLDQIQFTEVSDAPKSRSGGKQPVVALVVSETGNFQNSAWVNSFRLRDAELNMSFEMETDTDMGPTIEVTFVSDRAARPLFCAVAKVGADGKCSVNAKLPANLAQDWRHLKRMDRLPFRLILRFPGR